jgi:hypothetical protein
MADGINSAFEWLSLLWCDTVSTGKQLLKFLMIVVYSSFGSSRSGRVTVFVLHGLDKLLIMIFRNVENYLQVCTALTLRKI